MAEVASDDELLELDSNVDSRKQGHDESMLSREALNINGANLVVASENLL